MFTDGSVRGTGRRFPVLPFFLFLVLIFLILVGWLASAQVAKVRAGSWVRSEMASVAAMDSCFMSSFEGRYAEIGLASALEADCVPRHLLRPKSPGVVLSPWDQPMFIAGAADGEDWSIRYDLPPPPFCSHLVPALVSRYRVDLALHPSGAVHAYSQNTPQTTLATDCSMASYIRIVSVR